jgi:hypothetical protein
VIGAPVAHIGGLPLEETLGSFGPALLLALGVAWTQLRARLRRVRSRATEHTPVRDGSRAGGPGGTATATSSWSRARSAAPPTHPDLIG